jgi:predicted phage tail protein
MCVADSEQIRVRLQGELKEKWERTLEARKISQQQAVVALLENVVGFDPLLQSMLFNQVPTADRAELSRIVMRRLSAGKSKVK